MIRPDGNFQCPQCHGRTSVKDSRPTEGNDAIRRRRQCRKCSLRFTTFEMQVPDGYSPLALASVMDGLKSAISRMAGALVETNHHLNAIEKVQDISQRKILP